MSAARPRRVTLFLRDFEILCDIGVHPHERQAPQRLVINVELEVDTGIDLVGDEVAGVVDYDFLRGGIRELVGRGHVNLQETLCWQIARFCLEQERVHSVTVSTEKPDAYPDSAGVGCRIEAGRSGRDAFPGAPPYPPEAGGKQSGPPR